MAIDATTITAAPTAVEGASEGVGLLWIGGIVATVAAVSAAAFARSSRRRRAEEQRRMEAIDSVGS